MIEVREMLEENEQSNSLPHQIRGSVRTFEQLLPNFPAFDRCIACSDQILTSFRDAGPLFVERICNDVSGKTLEEISGISELTRDLDELDIDITEYDSEDERN